MLTPPDGLPIANLLLDFVPVWFDSPVFSPNDHEVALSGGSFPTTLWNCESGKPTTMLTSPKEGNGRFLPPTIYSVCPTFVCAITKRMTLSTNPPSSILWLKPPAPAPSLNEYGPDPRMMPITFSPDGKYLLVCAEHEGPAEIWTLEGSLHRIATLSNARPLEVDDMGRNFSIWTSKQAWPCPRAAAFTPSGRILVLLSDTAVEFWDVKQQSLIAALFEWQPVATAPGIKQIKTHSAAGWIVVTPSGTYDGSPDALAQFEKLPLHYPTKPTIRSKNLLGKLLAGKI